MFDLLSGRTLGNPNDDSSEANSESGEATKPKKRERKSTKKPKASGNVMDVDLDAPSKTHVKKTRKKTAEVVDPNADNQMDVDGESRGCGRNFLKPVGGPAEQIDVERIAREDPASEKNGLACDGDALINDGEALTGDGVALTSDGGALTSDGDALTSDGDALTSDGDALISDGGALTSDADDICTAADGFGEATAESEGLPDESDGATGFGEHGCMCLISFSSLSLTRPSQLRRLCWSDLQVLHTYKRRPAVNEIQCLVSTPVFKIKFRTFTYHILSLAFYVRAPFFKSTAPASGDPPSTKLNAR
jgi:hypothetical protein